MPRSITRQDIRQAGRSLGFFAELIESPLTPWQLEALSLPTRQTVLVAPRQTGKSYSLAVLACWWAFRRPDQMVLIISASEASAFRLLAAVRKVAAHPLLHASVDDENQGRVKLTNGSQIQSLPSSERAIRGASVDLLIVDECAFVTEDVLEGAAIPTTAARPGARLVFASTPWGDGGGFWNLAQQGLNGGDGITRTWRWSLGQAAWIVPEVIEAARRSLPPLRFAAEYLGEWVPSGDAYFPHEDIRAAVASYGLLRDGSGMPAVMGLDWGRMQDASAIVLAGLLDDYGTNGRPCVLVPHLQTSRKPYPQQYAEIEALARTWDLTVVSETRGVGVATTDSIAALLNRNTVTGFDTSQKRKEDAYGRVALLLSNRQLALPDDDELLRQMMGVSAEATLLGGLRIGAKRESVHDDLPDALAFAIYGMPKIFADVPRRDIPQGITWTETAGGLRIPQPYTLIRAEASLLGINGDVVYCTRCGLPYPARKPACQWPGCGEPNPAAPRDRPLTPLRPAEQAASPGGNWWNPGIVKCPEGHSFDRKLSAACHRCQPGGSARAMPAAFSRALTLGRR